MAARIPYVEREQAAPEIRAVYDATQQATGRVPNLFRLMAHHARSLPGFAGWYPKLREGELDLKLRQLAYVHASRLNDCGY